ncbi:P22AR C-terminal domain-containing protein [Glaesserella parasuis]|uniref:P22AR C-terminal domain-containing protein n=1 Tax=Glaesserella parasuis TaxID=738 RepID=UPI002436BC67|nr:P22AR C-terminal domain-containing protein [Glaesserella parasuis]MDG6828744.1 P22AR C-terminal domain-containing protein [Glaesserella parasuis]MDO9926953.1 P22AR C-terminal domain-containing protein [Glaesserella parasuis]MDO9931430.1 P22AR C-terminal domain-containing protein [Glaesserella parasuis]MDO9982506.1 P22AR C-terminal domain-containing protein [Glaesserella parasuis]MDP0020917.1 P22AR C-terminal domain-containing protein [Glaesserella parasuis]
MSNLQILSTSIRQLDNLFNLKDLHIVAGNEKKHEPYLFVRLDTTKELIEEIQKEDPTTQPLKTLRGTQGGTYACEELALAYAMWISPKFHLVVLRAFLAMHKGELQNQPQPLALPEPEKKYTFEFTEDDLLDLTWAWFAFIRGIHTFRAIYTPLNALGSNYSAMVYGQGYEYATTARNAHKVIQRLTKDIAYDYTSNWRVLKHVREFDPTFKKSIL